MFLDRSEIPSVYNASALLLSYGHSHEAVFPKHLLQYNAPLHPYSCMFPQTRRKPFLHKEHSVKNQRWIGLWQLCDRGETEIDTLSNS